MRCFLKVRACVHSLHIHNEQQQGLHFSGGRTLACVRACVRAVHSLHIHHEQQQGLHFPGAAPWRACVRACAFQGRVPLWLIFARLHLHSIA